MPGHLIKRSQNTYTDNHGELFQTDFPASSYHLHLMQEVFHLSASLAIVLNSNINNVIWD